MMSNPRRTTPSPLGGALVQEGQGPEPTQPVPLVQVDHVTAGYGAVTVLRRYRSSIYPQRTVAVVGESGSGKSTAARVITGLLPPSQGQFSINGEALPAISANGRKDQLRKAQMIYQMPDTAINPRQRIRDIIGRPLAFYLGLRGNELDQRLATC